MTSPLVSSIASAMYAGMKGLFLDATLDRDTAATGANDWTPGTITTSRYTCKAVHETYGVSDLAGGLVESSDRKVLILAGSLSVEPLPGDRITIRGDEFTIVPGNAGRPAVSTDPAKAVWECRAKSA